MIFLQQYAHRVQRGLWKSNDGLWTFVFERSAWSAYYGEQEEPARRSRTIRELVIEAHLDTDVEGFKRRLAQRG